MNQTENLKKINQSFFKLSSMTQRNSYAATECTILFQQLWRSRQSAQFNSSSDREEDNVQYLVPAEEEKKKN